MFSKIIVNFKVIVKSIINPDGNFYKEVVSINGLVPYDAGKTQEFLRLCLGNARIR